MEDHIGYTKRNVVEFFRDWIMPRGASRLVDGESDPTLELTGLFIVDTEHAVGRVLLREETFPPDNWQLFESVRSHMLDRFQLNYNFLKRFLNLTFLYIRKRRIIPGQQ